MSIKLILLKSGEDIIANVSDIISEEDNTRYAYLLENPYVVQIIPNNQELLFEETNSSPEKTTRVSFTPWIPLSNDKKITVVPDWVVTIVEPTEAIKKSYEDKMNGK